MLIAENDLAHELLPACIQTAIIPKFQVQSR